jgi:tripeptide aminopeptidase
VERTTVRLLIRDFRTEGLRDKEDLVRRLAEEAAAAHPGSRVDFRVDESYRNMKEVLDHHPEVVDRAREALLRAGLEPRMLPIRGGTDGSRLCFMGLPTPNLFAGEHNFHSRHEWVSTREMHKAVEVIIELCRVWEESA